MWAEGVTSVLPVFWFWHCPLPSSIPPPPGTSDATRKTMIHGVYDTIANLTIPYAACCTGSISIFSPLAVFAMVTRCPAAPPDRGENIGEETRRINRSHCPGFPASPVLTGLSTACAELNSNNEMAWRDNSATCWLACPLAPAALCRWPMMHILYLFSRYTLTRSFLLHLYIAPLFSVVPQLDKTLKIVLQRFCCCWCCVWA